MMLYNNVPIEKRSFSEDILNTGLSLYEVCRVFRGSVIFLEDNLLRLENSIRKSNVNIDIHALHIKDKLDHLVRLEGIKEGNLKYVLHITSDAIDEYIYQIRHSYPTEEAYRSGVDTITYHAMRDNAEIKYINPHLRETTNELIRSHGVYEILLIDQDECITEGSRSNVFFIRDNIFYTTPVPYVLPGTSRKRVLEICRQENFPVVEKRVSCADLENYDTAFITGTSPLVLPIRKIDHLFFNPAHPLLRKVMERYFSLLTLNF